MELTKGCVGRRAQHGNVGDHGDEVKTVCDVTLGKFRIGYQDADRLAEGVGTYQGAANGRLHIGMPCVNRAVILDAPVSGGEVGAKAATLTIMAGGSQDAFERARPYFRPMGKNISHVGESGAGQVCKVANQIIVALNIEAVGETCQQRL